LYYGASSQNKNSNPLQKKNGGDDKKVPEFSVGSR